MHSILFDTYGSSQDLKLGEKPKPIPQANEVLIKLQASSVNDWDWGLMRGQPFINRILFGLFKPKVKTLGIDMSGVIEAIGEDIQKFTVGEEVYGDISDQGWGAYAEYVCVKEDTLTKKPTNMSHEEAATIPHSGVLAIQSYLDYKKLQPNDTVLINGAGGGGGSIAIQLGKYWGLNITAVDKAAKLEMMKKLGADEVIDYQQTDVTQAGKQFDLIIDFAAHRGFLKYKKCLKKEGNYVLVGGSSSSIIKLMFLGFFVSLFGSKKYKPLMHQQNKHLDKLSNLLEEKTLKPTIGKVYPLAEVPEALDYYGQGVCNGKVIIRINGA